MRESCFRGKRIPHGEWVNGFYGKIVDYFAEKERDFIQTQRLNVNGSEKLMGNTSLSWFEVDPDTVGEFSGKRDKNDRRIFEGDIGRYRQTDGAKRNGTSILCTGKVIYNTETASYAVESRDEAGCRYFDYFPIKDFEVIGNIYDNPELLEVEE